MSDHPFSFNVSIVLNCAGVIANVNTSPALSVTSAVIVDTSNLTTPVQPVKSIDVKFVFAVTSNAVSAVQPLADSDVSAGLDDTSIDVTAEQPLMLSDSNPVK